MTTASPENFDNFAAQLADIVTDIDVVDVSSLDNPKLLTLFRELNDELESLREEMVPRTDRGREVHSLRAACVVELKQRQLT